MYIIQFIVLPRLQRIISCSISILVLYSQFAPAINAQQTEPGQQEKELYAQQLMVKAMTQGFLGYHDKAIPLYEEALNLTPSSATISSALAESYEYMAEYSSALFYARQALSLDSTEIHFHRHLARLYIQTGDNAMAEATLQALLVHFPNDLESLSDLVEIQALNGDLDKALQSNQRLIDLEGPQVDLLSTQLDILRSLQRWDEYETVLIERENLSPESIDLKKDRIDFYIDQNRTSDAITLIDEALSISPAHPMLTSIRLQLGSGEQPPVAIQTDQLIDPTDPQTTFQNAQSLYDANPESPEALSAVELLLRNVIELSPDYFDALTLLGTVLVQQEKYEEAAPLLKKAVNQNPRFLDLWVKASYSYLITYNYKESATLAEDALLLFPGQLPLLRISTISHIKVYNNSIALDRSNEYLTLIATATENESEEMQAEMTAFSGLLFSRLEDFERADNLYEEALKLSPNNPAVMSTVAQGLAERGVQLKKALDLANRSVEISPNNPLFMGILGRVFFTSNDITNAEKWLNLSVGTANYVPETHEYLGDLLLEKGNTREALSSWNRALQLNPGNTVLSEKVRAHAN